MGYKTASRSVPNPLSFRRGGTREVDLAVGADEAVAGMREDYSYNRGPDRVTDFTPNREGSPFDDYAYGAGRVRVTETASEDDGCLLNDVQSEPGPSDGEAQSAGGRQQPVARYAPTTRRRDGY